MAGLQEVADWLGMLTGALTTVELDDMPKPTLQAWED